MTGKDEMAASSGGLHVEKEKSPAAEERTMSVARQSKIRAPAGKAGEGGGKKRKPGRRKA